MLSFNFKKKLLIVLITLAVFLLAVDILLQNSFPGSSDDEVTIDEKKLSQRFRNILSEFGIEDGHIKENKLVDTKSKRKISNFKVQVPKDLSIPEVLQGIYQSFRKDSLTINSIEKIKGGKSTFALKFGASTLLQAEFDYSKNYSRNKGFIAFILYDVDLGNPSVNLLIESPTKLNFLIRPDPKQVRYLEFITKSSQQFSVLIDDEISEQKYQLGPSFSEQRIVNVVKTLVTDFQKAVCFVVDENSDFYKSANYEVLKREFLKRNIKLFNTTDFVKLNYDETIVPAFKEKLDLLQLGESIIFLVDEENYLVLIPEIKIYQKKGYRVITSSLLL